MNQTKIYCIKCKKNKNQENSNLLNLSSSSFQAQSCFCKGPISSQARDSLKEVSTSEQREDRNRPSAAQELFFYGSILAAFGFSMALSFLIIMDR